MFQPVIPSAGLTGWRFLERTLDTQLETFSNSGLARQSLDYFRENISKVTTPEALVADRRLLSVALEAYGLSDDINSRFFIRRVLEDGTTDPAALSNRLSDKRYRDFSEAFGFGEAGPPNTTLPGFAQRIAERYTIRSFESAVGEQSQSMRLALNARSALPELALEGRSERAAWFTLMGTPPLRELMEGALALPNGFGALDIDRQLEEFQDRAESAFGVRTVEELASSDVLDRVIDRFLLLSDTNSFQVTSPALQLLRGF